MQNSLEGLISKTANDRPVPGTERIEQVKQELDSEKRMALEKAPLLAKYFQDEITPMLARISKVVWPESEAVHRYAVRLDSEELQKLSKRAGEIKAACQSLDDLHPDQFRLNSSSMTISEYALRGAQENLRAALHSWDGVQSRAAFLRRRILQLVAEAEARTPGNGPLGIQVVVKPDQSSNADIETQVKFNPRLPVGAR